CAHEVGVGDASIRYRARLRRFVGEQQRVAGILAAGQRRRRVLEALPIARHPTLQPAFQCGLDRDSMDRIDVDDLEQTLPVVTAPYRATPVGMVEESPQREEIGFAGPAAALPLPRALTGHP